MFTYRPPKYDKKVLFQKLSKTISQVISKYNNILVAGDLNIDVSGFKGLNDNHFSELTDTFNQTNLVKTRTCFKTTRGTLLDVLLRMKPIPFEKTGVCETWDQATALKWYLQFFAQFLLEFPPKLLNIETIKILMKTLSWARPNTVNRWNIQIGNPYSKLAEIFQEILQKHAVPFFSNRP